MTDKETDLQGPKEALAAAVGKANHPVDVATVVEDDEGSLILGDFVAVQDDLDVGPAWEGGASVSKAAAGEGRREWRWAARRCGGENWTGGGGRTFDEIHEDGPVDPDEELVETPVRQAPSRNEEHHKGQGLRCIQGGQGFSDEYAGNISLGRSTPADVEFFILAHHLEGVDDKPSRYDQT